MQKEQTKDYEQHLRQVELEQLEPAKRPRQRRITVTRLKPWQADLWDSFVEGCESGLPTQLSGWEEILSRTYRYPCHFLIAFQGERICGALPLFQVSSALMGRSLQSTSGGICAVSPEAARSLASAADDLATELGVDFLWLRDSREPWDVPGWELLELHRGVRINLPEDPETAWNNFRKDVRYHIRNGMKKGDIRVLVGRELLSDFYEVLLRFNHQMGTPLFGLDFLLEVSELLPSRFTIANAYYKDRAIPVAGFFNLYLRDASFGVWGGSLHSYASFKVTHQVFWELIRFSINQGDKKFDMGRSAYPSSQFDFKAQWGDETYPIFQLCRVYRGNLPGILRPPAQVGARKGSGSTRGKQYSVMSRFWRALPFPLARWLGPMIRRQIPFG